MNCWYRTINQFYSCFELLFQMVEIRDIFSFLSISKMILRQLICFCWLTIYLFWNFTSCYRNSMYCFFWQTIFVYLWVDNPFTIFCRKQALNVIGVERYLLTSSQSFSYHSVAFLPFVVFNLLGLLQTSLQIRILYW